MAARGTAAMPRLMMIETMNGFMQTPECDAYVWMTTLLGSGPLTDREGSVLRRPHRVSHGKDGRTSGRNLRCTK